MQYSKYYRRNWTVVIPYDSLINDLEMHFAYTKSVFPHSVSLYSNMTMQTLIHMFGILETTPKSSSSQKSKFSKSLVFKKRKLADGMDDYQEEQVYHATNGDSMSDYNVATLLNMGNTCFLNSVLYALRFTPTFLHNLHHLLLDLNSINSKLKETKTKTSSLGRNGSAVSGSSWRSASSKDLLSIGTAG